MDVHELRRRAYLEKDIPIRLYNPLLKDFSVQFNDGSGIKTYTLKSKEIEAFPTPIAKHIRKHLVDFVINERGVISTDRVAVSKIKEEIEVKLWPLRK